MSNEEWQKKANENQNEKRKGSPYYPSVRLSDEKTKVWLDKVVKKYKAKHGATKEASLIAAYKLLEAELKK